MLLFFFVSSFSKGGHKVAIGPILDFIHLIEDYRRSGLISRVTKQISLGSNVDNEVSPSCAVGTGQVKRKNGSGA